MEETTTRGTCGSWRQAYPEIWRNEQEAFAAAGASWFETTPVFPAEDLKGSPEGELLTLYVLWPHPAPRDGDPSELTLHVTYPAAFPWFPPRVELPKPLPGLLRHHNPFDGTLCLLGDDSDWEPGTTLAALLTEQLPRLLAAGRAAADDAPTSGLELGAEPAWAKMRISLGGVLVDSACTPPPDVLGGWADVARLRNTFAPVTAIAGLSDGDKQPLWRSAVFRPGDVPTVPWARVPAMLATAEALWQEARHRWAAAVPGGDPAEPSQLLVLVASERELRRPGEDWLLLNRTVGCADAPAGTADGAQKGLSSAAQGKLILFDPNNATPSSSANPVDNAGQQPGERVQVRRGFTIGRADLTARLPGDTAGLADASVTVVGVGAVGGPIALELTRAGVGALRLVDGDTHDPATNARQLGTLRDAGNPKALAIGLQLIDVNPYLHVSARVRSLGADDGRELPQLTASTLVVDATANPAVNRYLAAHLRLTGTPLLIASATAGGWGGSLVTLPSVAGGCWECLQLHRIDRSVPWPPARPDGQLTPVGCSHPTYVGGYFDLGMVALQAARTALALLTPASATDDRGAAGSAFGDVQILTQYRRGRPVHPHWQSRELTVHPACPLHRPTAGRPVGTARLTGSTRDCPLRRATEDR